MTCGYISRLMTAATALILSSVSAFAQPKALGATFSFSGLAVSYEHMLAGHNNSFVEASLKAEMAELFMYHTDFPGISASVTWNIPIKQWISVDGNRLTFFAGPGVIAGYGHDYKQPPGAFFGLKGRVGVECSFVKKVVISAFLSPVLGAHLEFRPEYLSMKYYRNGLMSSLIPEVGIKYRF